MTTETKKLITSLSTLPGKSNSYLGELEGLKLKNLLQGWDLIQSASASPPTALVGLENKAASNQLS